MLEFSDEPVGIDVGRDGDERRSLGAGKSIAADVAAVAAVHVEKHSPPLNEPGLGVVLLVEQQVLRQGLQWKLRGRPVELARGPGGGAVELNLDWQEAEGERSLRAVQPTGFCGVGIEHGLPVDHHADLPLGEGAEPVGRVVADEHHPRPGSDNRLAGVFRKRCRAGPSRRRHLHPRARPDELPGPIPADQAGQQPLEHVIRCERLAEAQQQGDRESSRQKSHAAAPKVRVDAKR